MIDAIRGFFDWFYKVEQDPIPKVECWTIRANQGFSARLESLARRSRASEGEVIERALGIYSWALSEAENGKVIAFITPEQKEELERGCQRGDR